MLKLDKIYKTIGAFIIIAAALIVVIFLKPKNAIAPINEFASKQLNADETQTTLFFAGDIMLSRNVAGKIYSTNDFTLPFKNVKDVTSSADIAFANLESPFLDSGNHSVQNSLIFNADPKSIAGLNYSGFDILSTANNHAFDQGIKGIEYTIKLLKDHGIIPVGTFAPNEAFDPSQNVISKNKIAYGFLSYSYSGLNDGGKTAKQEVADFNDLDKLKQDIISMRGHYADVVIVNMHAGVEYTRQPAQKQIDFAHAAIDAGADLVIGEHPHWIQTVEQYKGKWIFYSLGNFVFDQMWSQETREGLTLVVTYDKEQIKKIELKPVVIDDYCCPRWANQEETLSILKKINLTSSVIFSQN